MSGGTGTGTLALNFTHGISVAHVFFHEKLGRFYRPSECWFHVYGGAGEQLERIRITRIWTMWHELPHRLGNDLAMFELERQSKYIDNTCPCRRRPSLFTKAKTSWWSRFTTT